MHFMHTAQMIFLLNIYMLITESTFYSLTTIYDKSKLEENRNLLFNKKDYEKKSEETYLIVNETILNDIL